LGHVAKDLDELVGHLNGGTTPLTHKEVGFIGRFVAFVQAAEDICLRRLFNGV
jgi:hypothetical protein